MRTSLIKASCNSNVAADRPDQDQAGDRRTDADRAQYVVRRRQRALHGPAHPRRTCREQQAFEYKQDAHTDEEVGERYGPHRTATSRLIFFCFLARATRLASPWLLSSDVTASALRLPVARQAQPRPVCPQHCRNI